jgi:hypothetical protein
MVNPARIYVSVPDEVHLSSDQVQFKKAILEAVSNYGFAPQVFYETGQPADKAFTFAHANELMAECHGAVILALTKWHHAELSSGRSAELASEFNHLEGGLALAHDTPLLLVTEEGMQRGGITYFGGGQVIHVLPSGAGADWVQSEKFKRYMDEWAQSIKEHRKVFLGYCSAAKDTATALIKYMKGMPDVFVVDYTVDFRPGPTILEEIERVSKECSVGVFLFTKDDEFGEGTDSHAAPRDNVIWEAGYFIHAKGKHRVLIIREEGAKMPADLGGVIYLPLKDRRKIGQVKKQIRRFLDTSL